MAALPSSSCLSFSATMCAYIECLHFKTMPYTRVEACLKLSTIHALTINLHKFHLQVEYDHFVDYSYILQRNQQDLAPCCCTLPSVACKKQFAMICTTTLWTIHTFSKEINRIWLHVVVLCPLQHVNKQFAMICKKVECYLYMFTVGSQTIYALHHHKSIF